MQHTGHKYDEAMEVNTIQVEYQMRRDIFARLLSFPLAKVQLSLTYWKPWIQWLWKQSQDKKHQSFAFQKN